MCPHVQGVLTVTLMRCLNLKGDEPNTYVRLILSHGDVENVSEACMGEGLSRGSTQQALPLSLCADAGVGC